VLNTQRWATSMLSSLFAGWAHILIGFVNIIEFISAVAARAQELDTNEVVPSQEGELNFS
jgi:hypothetical protein